MVQVDIELPGLNLFQNLGETARQNLRQLFQFKIEPP